MSDQHGHVEPDAPEKDPGPAKRHGDAFLDQSGSRQGHPHERTEAEAERKAEAEARSV